MPGTVPELMKANIAVFDERDPERRRMLIADTYAEDVIFTDPESAVTGRDALNGKAQTLLDQAPGARFRENGPLQVSGNLGHLPWKFGLDGKAPLATGIDIAIVAEGCISDLHTLVDAPATD